MRGLTVLCMLAIGCGPRTEAGATGAIEATSVAPSATASAITSDPSSGAPTASSAPAKQWGPTPEVAIVVPGRLHVKGKEYEGVIADGGQWTLSPGDVADVEAVLGPALAGHELGKHQPARDLKREYRGMSTADGKKTVEIQLSCEAPGWPVDPLPSVKGGGACYGRASYDVATRRITNMWANGPR